MAPAGDGGQGGTHGQFQKATERPRPKIDIGGKGVKQTRHDEQTNGIKIKITTETAKLR